MGIHVEWMAASEAIPTIARRGEEIGGETVTAEMALVLGADDLIVMEGSKQELANMLRWCLNTVEFVEEEEDELQTE